MTSLAPRPADRQSVTSETDALVSASAGPCNASIAAGGPLLDDIIPPDLSVPRRSRCACSLRCATLLAWWFAVATIAINICDVASDVVVAIEFYHAGRITWFWLVMASLMIGSVVYAVFGALVSSESASAFHFLAALPAGLRFVLLLPIAQLFPLIHVVHQLHRRARAYDDDATTAEAVDILDEYARRPQSSRATKDTLGVVADEMRAQAELNVAFKHHFDTYFPLYVESAVEALPQAAIQIAAVAYFNEATPAQIVSICLSLSSVASKLLFILRTFDVRLSAFRVLCAVHDLLSTCYLLSSILAPIHDMATMRVLGITTTVLNVAWGCKFVVMSIGFVLLGFSALLKEFLSAYRRGSSGLMVEILWISAISGIALGPLLLTAEAMRLSLFGWYMLSKGPRGTDAGYRLCVDFLLQDGVENFPLGSSAKEDPRPPSNTRRAAILRHPDIARQLVKADADVSSGIGYFTNRKGDTIFVLVASVLQLLSFAYPFVNVALHRGHQSPLQWLFFTALCLSLAPVALLAPYAWRRFKVMQWLHLRVLFAGPREVAGIIAAYYSSADVQRVLASVISTQVLPHDVTLFAVAVYVPSDGINVTNLNAKDFDDFTRDN